MKYSFDFKKNFQVYVIILTALIASLNPLAAQRKTVAITIDDLIATPADYSDYIYVNTQILKILKENDIKAVGFVNEEKLYSNDKPDLAKIEILRDWIEAGMELGNHTFSHIYINNATLEDYKSDVIKGESILRPLLKKFGKELEFFRHTQLRTGPTDKYREELRDFLTDRGYTIAPVTIDNDEYVYAYCYAQAKKSGDAELTNKIGKDYLDYMEKIFGFL